MSDPRPRYSDRELPPYSYVPGHAPHPVSDQAGHMHGLEHAAVEPLLPDKWQSCEQYLYALDLFNHGYYWESHEAWESLWLAAGRVGARADFLKGLIKLAATCVKAREGNPRGVARHAARAIELLSPRASETYCGLDVGKVIDVAQNLSHQADAYSVPCPTKVFEVELKLRID